MVQLYISNESTGPELIISAGVDRLNLKKQGDSGSCRATWKRDLVPRRTRPRFECVTADGGCLACKLLALVRSWLVGARRKRKMEQGTEACLFFCFSAQVTDQTHSPE